MNKEGGLFPLPTLINPSFQNSNAPRDRDKHNLGRFLVFRLGVYMVHLFVIILIIVAVELLGTHSKLFPWQRWCDFAALHGLCLYNWASDILAPGPDFDIRTLKSDELRRLMERVNWDNNPLYTGGPELDIRRWQQPGMSMYFFVSVIGLCADYDIRN
jgi:hypothetical protein